MLFDSLIFVLKFKMLLILLLILIVTTAATISDKPPSPAAASQNVYQKFDAEFTTWKCVGCRGAVEVLKFLYERNATEDVIIRTANYVCRHFADVDAYICKGITTQFQVKCAEINKIRF